MNFEIIFSEKQKFTQWWVWLILLGIPAIALISFFSESTNQRDSIEPVLSNPEFLIMVAACLLPILFFWHFRLETQIRKDGIYVRFFP